MADDKKLDRARKKPTNIRAALIATNEKGVSVERNGAMAKTPSELGRETDIEQ